MIRTTLLSFLACLISFSIFAQGATQKTKHPYFKTTPQQRSGSFTYSLSATTDDYVELTGATSINNGEIWDDPEYSFTQGFPFILNGEEVSGFQFIGTGSIMGAASEDPDVIKLLFPFESDLVDRGIVDGVSSESPISGIVEGVPGSFILKLEFKNAGSFFEFDGLGTTDMFVNFQIWLYEGSNKIEFRYGPSNVEDANLFYGGEPGPFAGLTDVNIPLDEGINPHFLTGNVNNPTLSAIPGTLTGTPPNGTVYTLFLNLPLDLEVTGENSTSSCEPNGTATANPSGGTEPYTYLWSNDATTQTISGLDTGTYTVTVTDDAGDTATGSVTITGVDELIANASATDETSSGANDGTATSDPIGGNPPYTYEWDNGESTQTIINLAPGVYRVTVTDESGCTDWQDVTVNAAGCELNSLDVIITHANCFGSCDGLITIFGVDGGVGPYTYLWNTGSTLPDIVDLCAGSYSVTVTDAEGCTIEATYTITEPDELIANAAAASESAPGANDGSAWAVPAGGVGPYVYEWSNGSTDSLITGLIPGEYTVIVTDDHLCADTQTVVVPAFGCGLLEVQVVDNSCFQSCDGSVTPVLINVVEPVTFIWSTGDTTATLSNLCIGDYAFTATDANGCVVTGSGSVSGPAEIFANASTTNETLPDANDGTAWAAPTGGVGPYTYLWSNGSTDSLITDLEPALYFVIVTDAIGCADTQVVFVLEFPCAGQLVAALTDASCFGTCDASVTLTVEGGVGPFIYNWGTGATDSTVTGLCAGLYDVTVTDEGQGCDLTATVPVDEPNPLVITIDSIVDYTDTAEASISISVTGGTPPYDIAWIGPFSFVSDFEDITDLQPGLYYVSVTDASDCEISIDSIEILDQTVGIHDPEPLEVKIHPNPATNQVMIDIQEAGDFKIQLNALDGKLMRTWNNEKRLDISMIPAGIYMMQFTSGRKFIAHKLVITK